MCCKCNSWTFSGMWCNAERRHLLAFPRCWISIHNPCSSDRFRSKINILDWLSGDNGIKIESWIRNGCRDVWHNVAFRSWSVKGGIEGGRYGFNSTGQHVSNGGSMGTQPGVGSTPAFVFLFKNRYQHPKQRCRGASGSYASTLVVCRTYFTNYFLSNIHKNLSIYLNTSV